MRQVMHLEHKVWLPSVSFDRKRKSPHQEGWLQGRLYSSRQNNNRICKLFSISHLYIKRWKSECGDSMDCEKDEDLTYISFVNHENEQIRHFVNL